MLAGAWGEVGERLRSNNGLRASGILLVILLWTILLAIRVWAVRLLLRVAIIVVPVAQESGEE